MYSTANKKPNSKRSKKWKSKAAISLRTTQKTYRNITIITAAAAAAHNKSGTTTETTMTVTFESSSLLLDGSSPLPRFSSSFEPAEQAHARPALL